MDITSITLFESLVLFYFSSFLVGISLNKAKYFFLFMLSLFFNISCWTILALKLNQLGVL